MEWKTWLYFGFTVVLTAVLAGIMLYFFRDKRRNKVESPKYRMMDED